MRICHTRRKGSRWVTVGARENQEEWETARDAADSFGPHASPAVLIGKRSFDLQVEVQLELCLTQGVLQTLSASKVQVIGWLI